MYIDDNSSKFPYNEEGEVDPPGWVSEWEDYSGAVNPSGAYIKAALLLDPAYTQIGLFAKSPAIFECRSDQCGQIGNSGAPSLRSYLMNPAVGPDDMSAGAGATGVQGSLL